MTRILSKNLKLLTPIALACLMTACISASAPKTEAGLIGEAMYSPQPWAGGQPVNITARVSTIQNALSAVQSVSDSYAQFQRDVADARYQREARSAAYESHLYFERLREEAEEKARLKAIEENDPRLRQVKIGTPQAIRVGPAPTMADYAEDIGNSMRGYAVSMRGWMAAGHPAYEYSDDYKQPTPQPRVKKYPKKD